MKRNSAVLVVLVAVLATTTAKEFSNTWVAEIGGGEEDARLVAEQLGFNYGGAIGEFDDHHILTREDHPLMSKSNSNHLTKSLLDHDQVKWAQQQSYVKRSLRDNKQQSLLTIGRKLTPLEVVEQVQIMCMNMGEFSGITGSTSNGAVAYTGPPQHSYGHYQFQPQNSLGNNMGSSHYQPGNGFGGLAGAIYSNDGEHWDPTAPNFVLPPGVIFSYGGGKIGLNKENLDTQGDLSKLGTFDTKPSFTSLSTYEDVTKHIRLKSIKTSAYKTQWSDPLWIKQWYLQDYRTTNMPVMDLNVVPVWKKNINGEGIIVGVVDNGIENNHPDLKQNYLENESYDYVNTNHGAQPDWADGKLKNHGTMCAGEIAMVADNNYCGVGVAYKAKIIGIKTLAERMRAITESYGQIYKLEKVDIYSNSWGPTDNGIEMEPIYRPTELALMKGVVKGRNGKGSVYVIAGGNGKHVHDNCAADSMVNNINMIAVAPISQSGKATVYGERCTGVFCAAYSSGYQEEEKVVSTDVGHDCTISASGTSAATPLVAGIIALVLQANGQLTYRDVMHIITMGCEVAPLADNGDIWYRNAKGFWVSNDFGFGVVNAENMVDLARNWVNVPKMTSCAVTVTLNPPLQFAVGEAAEVSFDTVACESTPNAVNYLETLVVTSKIKFPFRGALAMYLTSPQGTRSHLLEVRPEDTSSDGLDHWGIKSVHNWGENPKGNWKIEVIARALGGRRLRGIVESFTLTFHGTAVSPDHYKSTPPRQYSDFRLPNGKTSKDPLQ